MTILEATLFSPMAIVLGILLISLVVCASARAWTNHRMEIAERESDEIDRLAFEAAPYRSCEEFEAVDKDSPPPKE